MSMGWKTDSWDNRPALALPTEVDTIKFSCTESPGPGAVSRLNFETAASLSLSHRSDYHRIISPLMLILTPPNITCPICVMFIVYHN